MLGLVFIAILFGYWPTSVSLIERWSRFSEAYGHGLLVFAGVCWLVWARIKEISAKSAAPSTFWASVSIGAAMSWVLAGWIQILIVQQMMLPILLYGSCATLYGMRYTHPLLAPLSLLYLIIPVWNILVPFLQQLAASAVGYLLTLSGITAHITGYQIRLPAGTIEIASSCSGLNYVLSALALSGLLVVWQRLNLRTAFLIVAAAVTLGVATNWVRIYLITVAAHVTEMEHWLVRDHHMFGWCIFVILVFPALYLSLERTTRRESSPILTPEQRKSDLIPRPAFLLVCLFCCSLPMASLAIYAQLSANPDARAMVDAIDHEASRWSALTSASTWKPHFSGADYELLADPPGSNNTVFTAVYLSQTQKSKISLYSNAIADPALFTTLDSRSVRLNEDHCSEASRTTLKDATDQRRVVIWWYQTIGGCATSLVSLKLMQLRSLAAGRVDASLRGGSTLCESDDENCEIASKLVLDELSTLTLFEHL